jgi:molybdopterin-containing oxidoreductase family membrane subunit
LASSGRWFWILAILLGLLVTWGAVAYVVQLLFGLETAGYDDHSFWGLYEADLVAFIGVSYGGALVSAILRLTQAKWRMPITRLAETMALFSLLSGSAFAIIHLGRPERFWRIIFTPKTNSPIVWDFVAVMTYLVVTLVFLYLPLIPDCAVLRDRYESRGGWRYRLYRTLALNWRGLPRQKKILAQSTTAIAILIIPIAITVHSVLSWAFAVTTRPGWHSTIFGPYFVVAALYSGVAAVILVVAGFRRGYRLQEFIGYRHFRNLSFLMLALGILYLYFTVTELLTEGYTMTLDATPVIESVLVGQYASLFWLFFIGGAIVPTILVALPWTRTIRGIVVASALVVASMWLKRLIIIVPAVTQPLISGSWGDFRVTWVSVGITIGAAAAIPLMMMLFFKLFPILDIAEMEEEPEAELAVEFAGVATAGFGPVGAPAAFEAARGMD